MVDAVRVAGYAALCFVVWKALAAVRQWTNNSHTLLHARELKTKELRASDTAALRNFFVTRHGLALYVRKWLPKHDVAPRGVVFIVHGLGEHAGRYDHIARVLVKAGFAVFAVDHQGHGMSDGDRMFAKKLVHLAEDYVEFVDHVLENQSEVESNAAVLDEHIDGHTDVDWKTLPRFLFGHSMGGTVALQIVELQQARHGDLSAWNGVVLSSPAIFCAPGGKSPAVMGFMNMLSQLIPRVQLPKLPVTELSKNEDVINRLLRDPLCPKHGASIRLSYEIMNEGRRFAQKDTKLTTEQFTPPVLLVHGEKDIVTMPEGSIKFHKHCVSKDKTIKLVPDAVHELFNQDGYDQLIDELVQWMEQRL